MKFQRKKTLNKIYNLLCRRFSNRINTLCVLILISMFLYYVYTCYEFHYVYKPKPSIVLIAKKNFSILSSITLFPKCLCQKETVQIREFKNYYNVIVENEASSFMYSYNLSRKIFDSMIVTCDLYKVLRRGPNQNIISYSIPSYDEVNLKYILKTNIKRAKNHYSNWVIRVYHKGTLTQNEECELECTRSHEKELFDNIDICDTTKLPIDFYNTWDASYIITPMLKYLPVGDDLVDRFVSRNIISCIFDREIAAVNEWLNSGKHFHVMRDHPEHVRNVIGDLWGFVNNLDRKFSKYMLKIFTDKQINNWYKSYDKETNPDEIILEKYVWYKANSTIIHDSYNCKKSNNFLPFPTQRIPENCYVGMIGCCGSKINNVILESKKCPKQCRPKNHVNDWFYC